ncbi:ABC transporter permease [Hamadaea tsunoensis]|uniref:ABC transporter permease n=1 Tax=Hamadaea tsunoensis TaxID=53368 RepID=UPI00042A5492|nr:ABC transporter permease [Hamadaea tsunoensis]
MRTVRRLSPAESARLGASGLRTRPLRVFLSALGIAIGIGAMLAVVGISASSHADLDRQLSTLGTNLLTVEPGASAFGEAAKLPPESTVMVSRIGPVQSVAATGTLDVHVYRNDHIPAGETGSIAVLAADRDLLGTLRAHLSAGSWIAPDLPTVVLGRRAAARLDIRVPGGLVWLGGRWYTVTGLLGPVTLAPELDGSAIIGWAAAQAFARFDGHPTRIYLRTPEDQVAAVQAILGATANPAAPHEVAVSRPSDALAAKQATDSALTALLVGLGGVALLVGGVGVANTMVISVLERRSEIGLRRALGATRGHVRTQFLAESLLLSALGGVGGVAVGIAVTAAYAYSRGWPPVEPAWATAGGVAATLVIGGIAGLYPAIRASRVAPATALAAG